MIFIDTNVAIELRDNPAGAGPRLADITPEPVVSLVTRIELEAGVEREPASAAVRRRLLDRLLADIDVIMMTEADVRAYGRIVASCGYNRRLVFDRLIAAQALNRNASLVTANINDFADISGLHLIPW